MRENSRLHTSNSKKRRESRHLLLCLYRQCRTITKPDSLGIAFEKIDSGYAMNREVYDSLIRLCKDICKRNGKKKLLWFVDKNKTLNYSPKPDEMVITVHRWFANMSYPGDWLYNRLDDLAAKVTAALGGTAQTPTADSTVWHRVRKTWADTKSQLGAYKEHANAKAWWTSIPI